LPSNAERRRVEKREVIEKRDAFRQLFPPVFIDSVAISGLRKKNQVAYARSALIQQSSSVTLSRLKTEYFKLLADNKIKDIYPTLVYDSARNSYRMNLQVERDDQFSVSLGGNISSRAITGAYLGLQYRYFGRVGLDLTANGYFGQFYSSVMVSPRLDIPGRFPLYIALNYTYNHKDYFRSTIYFFEDKQPSYLIQNETHFGFDIGFPASNNGKVLAGLSSGYTKDEYYQNNTFTRLDTADRTYFNFLEGRVEFELNSLNRKQFADRGARLLLQLKYLNGDERTVPGSTSAEMDEVTGKQNWLQFRLLYDNYFKHLGPVALGFYGELQLSNQGLFSNYTATLLRSPAFEPLPEMKTLFLPNYRAQNYAGFGIKSSIRLFKQLKLRIEGYLFQPYEELAADENGNVIRRKELSFRSYIASATLVYHTPVAPISLSFNYYDRAENGFSVLFNIGFIIFNRDASR
jgi:NTE family protein